MSYSIRDQARRKIKQAIGNCDSILSYLQWFEETYRDEHPELADIALAIGASQVEVQELLDKFLMAF